MLNEDDKEEEEGGDNNEEEIDEDEVVGKISEVVDWDGSEKEDVVLEKEEEVEEEAWCQIVPISDDIDFFMVSSVVVEVVFLLPHCRVIWLEGSKKEFSLLFSEIELNERSPERLRGEKK